MLNYIERPVSVRRMLGLGWRGRKAIADFIERAANAK